MAQLLDLETNQFVDIPEGEIAKAVYSGRFGFPSGQPVLLRGPEGSAQYKPEDAVQLIAEQGFEYVSPERQEFEQRAELRESAPEQLKTIAEGAVKAATVGLDSLALLGAEKAAPEEVKAYKQRALEREFFNPQLHAATDVGVSIALGLMSGGKSAAARLARMTMAGMADRVAVKAGKLVAEKFGTKGLAGIARVSTKLATEGAIDGAAFSAGDHIHDAVMNNEELTADGVLNAMGVGAAMGGATGGLLGATGKGFIEAYKKTSQAVSKKMRDFAELPGNIGEIEKVEHDVLKHTRNEDFTGQKGIFLKPDESGKAVLYKDKNRSVLINPEKIEGNILDMDDVAQLDSFGNDIGIINLADRLDDYTPGDGIYERLVALAIEDDAHITPELMAFLKDKKDMFSRKIVKLNKLAAETRRRSDNVFLPTVQKQLEKIRVLQVDALEEMKKRNLVTQRELDANQFTASRNYIEREVKNLLGAYDGIKFKDSYIIKKSDVLSEALEQSYRTKLPKKGKKFIKRHDVSILRALGFKAREFNKTTEKQIKELAQFARDHYRTKFQGATAILTDLDEFLGNVNNTMDKSVIRMDDSLAKLENYMIQNGVESTLTGEEIGNYLLRKYKSELTDPVTGRVLPESASVMEKVKEIASGYKKLRMKEVQPGVYKQIPFSPIELREMRKRLDQTIKKFAGDLPMSQQISRDIRFKMEEDLIKLMSREEGASGLVATYKQAKKDFSLGKTMNDLVDGSFGREAGKNGLSLTGYISGGVTGMMGAIIDPSLAIPAAIIGAGARKITQEFGDNIESYLLYKMYTNNIDLVSGIEKASSKFLERINRPIAVGTVKTQGAKVRPMTYEKYEKKYDEVITSYENLLEDFNEKENLIGQMAPGIANALFTKIYAAEKILEEKFPKTLETPFSKQKPDFREISKFNRYLKAVESPANILQEFESGVVSDESIEVLNRLYPEIYQRIFSEVMESAAKTGSLGYRQRLEINRIFGIETNVYDQPGMIRHLQGLRTPTVEQKQKPGNTRTRKTKDTVSPARETQSQRLQRR